MHAGGENQIRAKSNEGDAKATDTHTLEMMAMTRFVCITYVHGMQNAKATNKSAI